MSTYSIEKMSVEGHVEVKELFEFVMNNSEPMDAYSMREGIFCRGRSMGLSAMRGYFAGKGTGEVGDLLELVDGTTLKKE